MMYDVVIVGSGLGGLVCGSILSKEGYKVCIVEQHYQIGGCLQTFKREGCVFDTGMHYVGSFDKGQLLNQLFTYFNIADKLKVKQLDQNAFDIISIHGEEYPLAQGHDNFIEQLKPFFPTEEKALIKYVDKLKEIRTILYDFINPNDHVLTSVMPDLKYYDINALGYISSLTSNTRLQNVLSGLNSLYSGHPDKSPLYVHAVINNSLIEGAWRFVDGGDQIGFLLASEIEKHGGSIIKKCKVEQFLTNKAGDTIVGLKTSIGESFPAKYYISDINPTSTINMIDTPVIRKGYRLRLNSMELTVSVFSLYIVLKENTFPYMNHNYYHNNPDDVWGMRYYSKIKWPGGYMLYTPATSKSDVYADSVIVMTYMFYEELKKWENTSVGNRGDDYKSFMDEKAELLIAEITKRFPALKNAIKSYYTSSPLTYRDYTGTINGSIYGILKDYQHPLNTIISQRTRLSNLLFTGQNLNLHGVLGVTMTALQTCGHFLGLNYLFNKVNNG